MSITKVTTEVIEDGSITKAKLDIVNGTTSPGQVLAIDSQDHFYFTSATTPEEVEDQVASLINNGTHTNITIVYDDAANSLSFNASGAVQSVNGLTGIVVLTTDEVTEGVNEYYTDQKVWDSLTVIDNGGDGSFSFDSNTGTLTYTGPSASDVYAHFSAGTGVSLVNGTISIGQAVATTSDVTFNDVIVSGNLTISGNTTTINTEELLVADNVITLNSDWDAGTPPTQNAGIEVNRGTETNSSLTWDETNDQWLISHKLNMNGTTIANLGTPILGTDAVTKSYVDSATAGITVNDSDDVPEGNVNLYYTDERVDDRVSNLFVAGPNIELTYDDANNIFTIDSAAGLTGYDLSINDTDDLSEGNVNLYFTETRSRDSISVSGDLSYDSANGIISFTERTDAEVRGLVSAAGDLSYDETNGIFSVSTYTSTDFDTDFSNKDTDDLSEGNVNLYFTETRARESITVIDNTGYVNYDTANGVVTISQIPASDLRAAFGANNGVSYDQANGVFSLDSTYSPSFVDLNLSGNLTVSGNVTTVETETLLVADNIVTLNSDVTGTPSENAGIEVERGTETNVGIRWNETVDAWQFTNDGIVYQNIGSLSASDTDDLAEGNVNLYFTDERAQDAVANIMVGGNNITFTYDDANNIMTIDGDISSTTDLPEGTNLYYTDQRWQDAWDLKNTDDLPEGNVNLYYSETLVDARVNELRTDLTQDGNASVHFNNLTDVPIVSTQSFTGNGTLTNFTLNDTPGSADAIIVTLNGVTQTPDVDYSVSGTTLTFTTPLPNLQVALVRFIGYQIAGSTPTGALPLSGGTMTGSILVDTDNAYDLGSETTQWRAIYGHTVEATYADLAERYEADKRMAHGTVVIFGGEKEITECTEEADVSVAGVISTEPAYKMNAGAGTDDTHPYVALRGRVPCKVIGPVRKGDLLVTSDISGYAKSVGKNDMGRAVFAKSLVEDLTDDQKIIEVVII